MTEPGRLDPEQTVVRAQPGPVPPEPSPSPAGSPAESAQSTASTPAVPPPVRVEPDGPRKKSRVSRIWSNLNLNGPVPARVRPAIGEWGPQALPSTKAKKRGRWIAPVAFAAALAVLILVFWFFMTFYR